MKKIFCVICTIFVLTSPGITQQVLDKIAAVVGDDIILQSELMQYSLNLAFQYQLDPRKNPDQFEQLQKETLQNLINQKILVAKAKEDTIEVDERQVDTVLEEQINRMIQQLGSEKKLEEQLNMSISKIKRSFRDDVRKNLMVEKLQQTKVSQIKITRREIEEFYNATKDSLPELKETVDLSHILLEIKAGKESERVAREKIDELLQRVKQGEKFEDLCRQYSEDPGNKDRGGEIGSMQRGDFVPEFEEVAFLLEPGEMSDIVKTRFGFHIIQSIDRKGDKINVRHLLIRLEANPGDESATEEQIKEIRAMFDKPEANFEELAKQYSDDATTKEQGGHIGKFEVENLQEREFVTAIQQLKPGEISQHFKTRFGWHILKLNERQEPRKMSLQTDWDKIELWALNLKRQKEFQKWLDEVKKDVYVDVKPN